MSATDELVRLGFSQPAPLPSALAEARRTFLAAAEALLTIGDAALIRPWRWRGESGAADVRYGFYRIYERLEEAAVEVERLRMPRARAAAILGQATAARWDLRGALQPLPASELDRPPGFYDWTLRQTMGHVISAQASYTVRTIYAVHRWRHDRSLPVVAADEQYPRLEAAAVAAGTVPEVLARLDDWLDVGIGWLAEIDREDELAAPTTWASYQVDARFRLERWSSHLREHTVQVDKSFAMLRREPSEVQRLVRLAFGAFGCLEGACLGLDLEGGAGDALAAAAADVSEHAGELASV